MQLSVLWRFGKIGLILVNNGCAMGGFTIVNLAQFISFKMRPQSSPCDARKYEWHGGASK